MDDEEHVRELLRDILARDGHEVMLAQTGHEALARCNETEFDAVFTDLGLPGMSGGELARALRERHAHLPLALCLS